jgi:DNA-binding CsgD family transcriptional regulator
VLGGTVEWLSTSDWGALVAVAAEIIDCQELPAVAAAVQNRAARLVGCDIASCHELDTAGANVVAHAGPAGDYPNWARGRFTALAAQNPMIAHHLRTGDTGALRLSDFASTQQLRGLELYQRTYRPIGIEHQLAFAFPLAAPTNTTGRFVRVSLSRQYHDFTERDRAVLHHLRPFVRCAYHNAFMRNTVSAMEPTAGEALVNDNGLVLTERERDVLAWVRTGKTNSQIAAELHISPHTVAKHLSHVYAKLGVNTRTGAVRQLPDHRRE